MSGYQSTADPCADTTPAPPPPPASNVAAWVLAGALLAILIVEVWANRTGRPTASQWFRRFARRHRWWSSFAASLIGVTLWHLLLGGPF